MILPVGASVATATAYKRKSFLVDEAAIRRARKALGVGTDAEAVRAAVGRVVEMEEFWRFMMDSRGKLARGARKLATLKGP
jgi:Arc/MetJ family transcription regulator